MLPPPAGATSCRCFKLRAGESTQVHCVLLILWVGQADGTAEWGLGQEGTALAQVRALHTQGVLSRHQVPRKQFAPAPPGGLWASKPQKIRGRSDHFPSRNAASPGCSPWACRVRPVPRSAARAVWSARRPWERQLASTLGAAPSPVGAPAPLALSAPWRSRRGNTPYPFPPAQPSLPLQNPCAGLSGTPQSLPSFTPPAYGPPSSEKWRSAGRASGKSAPPIVPLNRRPPPSPHFRA